MASPPPQVVTPVTGHTHAHARKTGSDLWLISIGASSGGLEAMQALLSAAPHVIDPTLPPTAYVYIQHLEPHHKSLLAEILARHTNLNVVEAAQDMRLEAGHLYIIPPAVYMGLKAGRFTLEPPPARHGLRLPIDYWFQSVASQFGHQQAAIILSGTGADGSLGLADIKAVEGLILVQEPRDCEAPGMPQCAIETGLIDEIAPAKQLIAALFGLMRQPLSGTNDTKSAQIQAPDLDVVAIIEWLQRDTSYDFSAYKLGTLRRRIERRMALKSLAPTEMAVYHTCLHSEPDEVEALAKDLLIHVTSFFRDAATFAYIRETAVPELIGRHPHDRPLRLWVAGCSTGEEAYSLAIIFCEALAEAKVTHKLQIFASDLDPDSVATAREGWYSNAIEEQVSPERLKRFFSKEDGGYRILPELRAHVVFTVQDVLSDPPFSRLDFISCRNLLIYLSPEAQMRVLAMFHFALIKGGTLLLGSAETVGKLDGSFVVTSKPERLYHSIGRTRLGETGLRFGSAFFGDEAARNAQTPAKVRALALEALGRKKIIELFAPAAVLINAHHECLYSLGPVERYLTLAAGQSTQNILAMAPRDLKAKLRYMLQQIRDGMVPQRVTSKRKVEKGEDITFDIKVVPLSEGDESLALLCFIDQPPPITSTACPVHTADGLCPETPDTCARLVEMEHELVATQIELQGAIRNLELSSEEQKAVNEEALSVNEEYQSTNEELLTSKEELQSLNEELNALNTQLHETLDRQRTTVNDLQNVLYSTDVATLFLDSELKIRFYTPATKALFRIIPGDVGRPLADLNSLAVDPGLGHDARRVLADFAPIECEIEAPGQVWYNRRILPYRALDQAVEGVVITYSDITERKATAKALETAMAVAEQANIAKSRFLAAASHDLRQPLQSLALLQGLLAKMATGEGARKLVAKLDMTLEAMSGMLNTLIDINQFEAGMVKPDKIAFSIDDLLMRLMDEFTYPAEARHLRLRVVKSSLIVFTDPALLEQKLRNLLSNALKYTRKGTVLLGCRRRADMVSVEVWDTGIGIAEDNLASIFDEYYQVGNAARERSLGLGLGLAIVKRLCVLLDHKIKVRSYLGKGTIFAIAIERGKSVDKNNVLAMPVVPALPVALDQVSLATGEHVLIIEDDPEVREILELSLSHEGYVVASLPDGMAALDFIELGTFKPDLILADFNLPNHMSGLQVAQKIRIQQDRPIPLIILTGDISTETMRDIAAAPQCQQLSKPVKLVELMSSIAQSLATAAPKILAGPRTTPLTVKSTTIYVVDDDPHIGEGFKTLLETDTTQVLVFESAEAFCATFDGSASGCVLIDAYLPGMDGLALLHHLRAEGHRIPVIMITGSSDVGMAVEAMKAGAADFLEKPVSAQELDQCMNRVLAEGRDEQSKRGRQTDAAHLIATLSHRQREVMDRVLNGEPSKNIAADLGISQRTVENHRAAIMTRTGAKSLPALARLALAARAVIT